MIDAALIAHPLHEGERRIGIGLQKDTDEFLKPVGQGDRRLLILFCFKAVLSGMGLYQARQHLRMDHPLKPGFPDAG